MFLTDSGIFFLLFLLILERTLEGSNVGASEQSVVYEEHRMVGPPPPRRVIATTLRSVASSRRGHRDPRHPQPVPLCAVEGPRNCHRLRGLVRHPVVCRCCPRVQCHLARIAAGRRFDRRIFTTGGHSRYGAGSVCTEQRMTAYFDWDSVTHCPRQNSCLPRMVPSACNRSS